MSENVKNVNSAEKDLTAEIKNLVVEFRTDYGTVQALNGLDLEIERGKTLGLVGETGAGKTTTIKCIVGIHDFDKGEILVDNISVKEDPLRCKERIAYIPDNPDLYEYLTGIQYLNFIADIFQIGKKEREERSCGQVFPSP